MVVKGLIAAAGMSSRMGKFKPLLEINGFPMIGMTIDSLRSGGIFDITVVTGNRAAEVEAAVAGDGVRFVRNERYASTDMLYSIKLGLASMSDADAVALLPGDLPAIEASTFGSLRDRLQETEADYLVPVYGGETAHPPIFRKTCFEKILSFDGDGGLRAALSGCSVLHIDTADRGCALDADTPQNLETLRGYAEAIRGVSEAVCRQLYDQYKTPDRVRAHCRAVAEIAAGMATKLARKGYSIDIELCRSGAMLHDLVRTRPYHSREAAGILRGLGYARLARIVEQHDGFESADCKIDEMVVVNLADKLIREDEFVGIHKRYQIAMELFPEGTEVGTRIRQDYANGQKLLSTYEELVK